MRKNQYEMSEEEKLKFEKEILKIAFRALGPALDSTGERYEGVANKRVVMAMRAVCAKIDEISEEISARTGEYVGRWEFEAKYAVATAYSLWVEGIHMWHRIDEMPYYSAAGSEYLAFAQGMFIVNLMNDLAWMGSDADEVLFSSLGMRDFDEFIESNIAEE